MGVWANTFWVEKWQGLSHNTQSALSLYNKGGGVGSSHGCPHLIHPLVSVKAEKGNCSSEKLNKVWSFQSEACHELRYQVSVSLMVKSHCAWAKLHCTWMLQIAVCLVQWASWTSLSTRITVLAVILITCRYDQENQFLLLSHLAVLVRFDSCDPRRKWASGFPALITHEWPNIVGDDVIL